MALLLSYGKLSQRVAWLPDLIKRLKLIGLIGNANLSICGGDSVNVPLPGP